MGGDIEMSGDPLRHLLPLSVTSVLQLSNHQAFREVQPDFAALLIAAAFSIVGLAIVRMVPKASLLAAFFLVGALSLNVALSFA